jgi:hypothetical protein
MFGRKIIWAVQGRLEIENSLIVMKSGKFE